MNSKETTKTENFVSPRNEDITVSLLRNRVGITTYYRYNYGSILQCYATCRVIESVGYQPVVLDVIPTKIKTLCNMTSRCICHPQSIREFFAIWKASRASNLDNISASSLSSMKNFIKSYIPIKILTAKEIQRIGWDDDYIAFLSGSDQIWNGHRFLIPSHYFLRFAPTHKRIAWAPSIGTSDIASYNRRIYKRYLSQYASLSVREAESVAIVQCLIGKEPIHLIDPVFLLSKAEWCMLVEDNYKCRYTLCYFLDTPEKATIEMVAEHCKRKRTIPFAFGNVSEIYQMLPEYKKIDGGPLEFISLICHAEYLFTDSFHGVSFAIIMHTPFIAFRRNYTHGVDQSSRLLSILHLCKMENVFEPDSIGNINHDFTYADTAIEVKRQEMLMFLTESISKAKHER